MVKKIDKKAVGQRIKDIRLKKGMTLEEFGGLLTQGKVLFQGGKMVYLHQPQIDLNKLQKLEIEP